MVYVQPRAIKCDGVSEGETLQNKKTIKKIFLEISKQKTKWNAKAGAKGIEKKQLKNLCVHTVHMMCLLKRHVMILPLSHCFPILMLKTKQPHTHTHFIVHVFKVISLSSLFSWFLHSSLASHKSFLLLTMCRRRHKKKRKYACLFVSSYPYYAYTQNIRLNL